MCDQGSADLLAKRLSCLVEHGCTEVCLGLTGAEDAPQGKSGQALPVGQGPAKLLNIQYMDPRPAPLKRAKDKLPGPLEVEGRLDELSGRGLGTVGLGLARLILEPTGLGSQGY